VALLPRGRTAQPRRGRQLARGLDLDGRRGDRRPRLTGPGAFLDARDRGRALAQPELIRALSAQDLDVLGRRPEIAARLAFDDLDGAPLQRLQHSGDAGLAG